MNNTKKTSIISKDGVSYLIPFILITSCFALWGFANDITNPMVKAFSKIFRMSVTDGALVQVAFYGGYFAMAFPAAMFIRKFSYKAGVLLGLGMYAFGAFLFFPAMLSGSYYPFLIAYFILTCGLSFLETSSNPYIHIVGVNRPILKNVATLKVTFYVLLFGLSLFLVRVDFGQSLHVVDKWYLWGNLIALAIFPTAISFLCTTQAVQYIGSTPTAILGALEPVTAVFFGVTIFGESLTPRLCCGIVLIILAVTFIIAGSNITTHLVRFRKLFPRLPIKKKGH